MIKDAILTTIRDNIPVEQILRVYMEETEEYEIIADKPIEQIKDNNIVVDASKNPISTDEKLELLAEQIKTDTAESLKESNKTDNIPPNLIEKDESDSAVTLSIEKPVNLPESPKTFHRFF